MRPIFSTACLTLAILFLVVAQIVSIGYFLYNWGSLDMAVGMAAWEGFVVWMKMVCTGLVLGIISAVSNTDNYTKRIN